MNSHRLSPLYYRRTDKPSVLVTPEEDALVHYTLQIKRCMDPNCFTPTKLNQELKWLPMSILDSSGLHFFPFDEVKLLKKAVERDRPSLKIRKDEKQPKNPKNSLPSSTSVKQEYVDLTSSIPMTVQNTRAVVCCVECENPQVIYSKNKPNHNQRMLLAKRISRFEYSCGAFLFPPDTNSNTAGNLCIYP